MKYAFGLAILLLAFVLVGMWDYAASLTDEAIAKQERADKIMAATAMVAPVQCDAYVAQWMNGRLKTRCYISKSKR